MGDTQYLAIGTGVTVLVIVLNLLGFISLPLIVRNFIKPKPAAKAVEESPAT